MSSSALPPASGPSGVCSAGRNPAASSSGERSAGPYRASCVRTSASRSPSRFSSTACTSVPNEVPPGRWVMGDSIARNTSSPPTVSGSGVEGSSSFSSVSGSLPITGDASCAPRVSALYDVRRHDASTARPSRATDSTPTAAVGCAHSTAGASRTWVTANAPGTARVCRAAKAVTPSGTSVRSAMPLPGSSVNSRRCSGAHSVLRWLGAHQAITCAWARVSAT